MVDAKNARKTTAAIQYMSTTESEHAHTVTLLIYESDVQKAINK